MTPTPPQLLKAFRTAHTQLDAPCLAAEAALADAVRADEKAEKAAVAATKLLIRTDHLNSLMTEPLRAQAQQEYDHAHAAHAATRAARGTALQNLIDAYATRARTTVDVVHTMLDALDPSGESSQLYLQGAVQRTLFPPDLPDKHH